MIPSPRVYLLTRKQIVRQQLCKRAVAVSLFRPFLPKIPQNAVSRQNKNVQTDSNIFVIGYRKYTRP